MIKSWCGTPVPYSGPVCCSLDGKGLPVFKYNEVIAMAIDPYELRLNTEQTFGGDIYSCFYISFLDSKKYKVVNRKTNKFITELTGKEIVERISSMQESERETFNKEEKMKIKTEIDFYDSLWAFDDNDVNVGEAGDAGIGEVGINMIVPLSEKYRLSISFWSTHWMVRDQYKDGKNWYNIQKWPGDYRPGEIIEKNWRKKIEQMSKKAGLWKPLGDCIYFRRRKDEGKSFKDF